MQTAIRIIALVCFCLGLRPAFAATGYYNVQIYPGDNFFQNGLGAADNRLSVLFGTGPWIPDGTTISLWNPAANAFDTNSTFSSSARAWSIDFTLLPGIGARLTTTSTFTATFVGEVLTHDGSPLTGEHRLPPVFSGPNGIYLLGDKSPVYSTGTNVFLHVLGRLPNPGEQFTRLNAGNQTYITSTYLGNGTWNLVPTLGVGEAGFFNIGPVGEPPARPSLSINLLGTTQVRVAWETNSVGYALQSSAAVESSQWAAITNAPVVLGNQYVVTLEHGDSPQLFRLKK